RLYRGVRLAGSCLDLPNLAKAWASPQSGLDRDQIDAGRVAELAGNERAVGVAWAWRGVRLRADVAKPLTQARLDDIRLIGSDPAKHGNDLGDKGRRVAPRLALSFEPRFVS